MTSEETKIGLSPFANWYSNCCSDIWSSPTFFERAPSSIILGENEYFRVKANNLLAYGARNCVVNCQIHGTAIRFTGSVKAFVSIHEKVITVSFARCLKTPKLFIGSNLGSVLLYHFEKNVIQTLNGVDVKQSELKFGSVIASADWADSNTVYYSKGYHVVQWNTERNTFIVAGLTSPSGIKSKIDTIKISKLDPLLLAVAFTGGQISILKLDGISIINNSLLATLNHGSDEITSMAFPFYYGDYTNGVLAAVSRNGWVKVWELDERKILADSHFAPRHDKIKGKNFYSVAFVPRPPPSETLNNPKPDESIQSEVSENSESELADTESPEKPVDKPAKKVFRHCLKLLASRADGKIALIDVPVDRRETKMNSLIRPLHLCGAKICHNNVVFNISVVNPFHYTSREDKRIIQSFWDEIRPLATSISLDRQIIVYDLKKLQSTRPVFTTLSLQVHDLEFNPSDHAKLLIACGDGLKIWHFNHNPHTHYKEGPTNYKVENVKNVPPATKILSAAWHPQNKDGETLIGLGTDQGTFICIDLNVQKIIYFSDFKLTNAKTRVYSCKWGPIPSDYASSLTRNWACYTVYAAGSVKAHVVADSKAFNLDELSENALDRSEDISKTECVWKDDYNYIAVGYEDGQIIICSNDGHFKPVIILDVHTSLVSCIRWHPDNIYQYDNKDKARVIYKDKAKRESWIASGSNDVVVQLNDLKMHLIAYHESKSKEIIHITKPDRTLSGHQDRIVSISWNKVSEDFLASCSADTTVKIWSIDLEIPLYIFRGHWSRVFAVAWAPWDGGLVFSAGDDSTVQVWSPSPTKLQTDTNILQLVDSIKDIPRTTSPVPEINEPSPSKPQYHQTLAKVLQDDDEQYSILESSNEHEIPEVSRILESATAEIINFPVGEIVKKATSTSSESQNTPKVSPDEKASFKQPVHRPSSRSSTHSSNNSDSIINRLRNADRTMAEISYKEKKKSLLPRSNIMENCSTKVQTLRDIEYLLFKRYSMGGSSDTNEDELRQRNLIFLDKDEINELCQIEISNHKQSKNFPLAFQITALQGNLKDMITEAVKSKQLSDWMVSQATSISREFWAKTVLAYAVQLERSGEALQSALYYSSIHRVVDATRVLVKAGLYKEALVLVKSRETYNSQLIKDILHAWAEVKQKDTNYEFAAKVYLANIEPAAASSCLGERLDDPKCQQLKRIIDSAQELKLDSEKDPDPPVIEFGLNNDNNDLTIINDS